MANNPSFLNLPTRLAVEQEQWKFILQQALFDLRVAAPGIIQSFDPVKQTVTAKVAIRERININSVPVEKEIPVLINVPVLFPRAGIYSLTLPVKAGDECLLIFGDMCMDAWWQSGEVQSQVERRRHDLSDAFALVGLWSQPRKLNNYSADSAQLRTEDGNVFVEIEQNAINLKAPTISIQSSDVTIQGNVTIQDGTLDVKSSSVNLENATTIQGHAFLTHKHTGVQTGGGNTGNVLP